jgi:hypothetical protein
MANASTELHLSMWRSGPTQAERLAAALLRLESYADVEPQAPLGGPDGRADILCSRAGYAYVAAVYFPPTAQTFNDVVEKFDPRSRGCHPPRPERLRLLHQSAADPQRERGAEAAGAESEPRMRGL